MTHSRTPNNTQQINERWTTRSGAAVELTVTVSAFDTTWKMETAIKLNSKEMRLGSFTVQDGKNIYRFSATAGSQIQAVVVSPELHSKVQQMIADAKTEIAPRIAEFNVNEAAELRAARS